MSLTPTQLSELQTIVETLRTEFPNSDDFLWQAAIRLQKGGLGPVTGPGGQAAFDAAVADIVEEAEQISTVQGSQGGLGNSFAEATFNVVPVEDNLPAGTPGGVIYLDVAPNTYAFTDVIELTPAGPNSVVLSEVGTQVARTVTAANGGLEVNNLNTGAGFERVLTASDLTVMATPGGVDTNIQFNQAGVFGGAADFTYIAALGVSLRSSQSLLFFDGLNTSSVEINNQTTILDVAAAGSTVKFLLNGLTLAFVEQAAAPADTAGQGQFWVRNDTPNVPMFTDDAGTDFVLNAGGTAVNPGTVEGQMLVWDNLNTEYDPTSLVIVDPAGADRMVLDGTGITGGNAVLAINGINAGSVNAIDIQPTVSTNYTAMIMRDQAGTNFFRWIHDYALSSANHELILDSSQFGNIIEIENEGNIYLGGTEASARLKIQVSAGFGAGEVLIDNGATLYMQEVAAAQADNAGEGQVWVRSDVPNTLMFTDDAGTDFVVAGAVALTLPTGTVVDAVMRWDGAAWVEATGLQVQAGAAAGSFEVAATQNISEQNLRLRTGAQLLVNTTDNVATGFQVTAGATSAAETVIDGAGGFNITNNAGIRINPDTGADILLQEGGVTRVQLDNTNGRFVLNDYTFFIEEIAAALADVAGYGQIWVRNDTPNVLMFTDDAGTDFELSTGPAAPQFIEQTTDTTVNNTTTLTNTQLTFTNIPAGFYRIDGMFLLRDVAVSGSGARIDCNVSGLDVDSVARLQNKNFSGAGAPSYDEIGLVTDLFDAIALVTGSGTSRFLFTGVVEFITGTNSFTVQFAQNVATVGDLDFEAGSFLALTPLN